MAFQLKAVKGTNSMYTNLHIVTIEEDTNDLIVAETTTVAVDVATALTNVQTTDHDWVCFGKYKKDSSLASYIDGLTP